MKLWLLLAGGVTLLFAWLALRAPEGDALPQAAALRTAVLPQAVPAPKIAPPAVTPTGIRVHGVLYRGARDAQSQALLSVQGGAAHVFSIGQAVAQGWSLAQVEPDHVVLVSGTERARLDVTYTTSAPPAEGTAVAARAVPAPVRVSLPQRNPVPNEEPLPGFVKSQQGAQAAAPPVSPETNQRFLEAVKSRREAGAPATANR